VHATTDHERAIVINERNMHRVWDVAYDGYNGGKGMSMLNWNNAEERLAFVEAQQNLTSDYQGKDILAVLLNPLVNHLPSPLPFGDLAHVPDAGQAVTDELVTRNTDIKSVVQRFKSHANDANYTALAGVCKTLNDELQIVPASFSAVPASVASTQNSATSIRLFYQGTIEVQDDNGAELFRSVGCGHHGPDYPGVASVRNGKSLLQTAAPLIRTAAAPQAQAAPVPRQQAQAQAQAGGGVAPR
jgi:HPt (histidine-containing phosphotransfer) domain-containing protein